MLDIDSYLRMPFLLILVLKRGGCIEGKATHDLAQTPEPSPHDAESMHELVLRFPPGPKWTHVESVLEQGRLLAAFVNLLSPFFSQVTPLRYHCPMSWRVHSEMLLTLNGYMHCQSCALAPGRVFVGKLPPLSPLLFERGDGELQSTSCLHTWLLLAFSKLFVQVSVLVCKTWTELSGKSNYSSSGVATDTVLSCPTVQLSCCFSRSVFLVSGSPSLSLLSCLLFCVSGRRTHER